MTTDRNKLNPKPLVERFNPVDGEFFLIRKDDRLFAKAWTLEDSNLIAAAPRLLAYAECEAAIACDKADPRYDPRPVLRSHGWNEQAESMMLFLSRIRRNAIEAATGSYLGRAA